MSAVTLVLSSLLIIHAAHSYILLTANLEDVQSLAKQLAASPVVDQINKIWRRAANQFNQHISNSQIRKRADDGDAAEDVIQQSEVVEPKKSSYLSELDSNNYPRRRKQDNDDLIALGKNASLYLKSIKQIFEKV